MRLEPALRIGLIYTLIGLTYVFVSDNLVEHLVTNSSSTRVQTAKGAGFVLLSALAIYLLIRVELRKQERLREAALRAQRVEAIGQFATVMAHDFNNMLMVVIGALEMSEDTLPPAHPARVHLSNSMNAAERAGELTQRMLVFSRQGQMRTQPVDVNQNAQELTPLLNLATGEQVAVRYSFSEDLPPVIAEPCKLQNILLNLIINARDAMPGGGDVVLETARERVESELSNGPWTVPPGDYVTVSVRDTGHGMSKQVMGKLLEPFFTTKPVGKGTGIGLTTTNDSMRAWRGHLMITSAKGRGTTVTMYLTPATLADSARPARGPDVTADSKGETILLVENDADVRAAVAGNLKSLGYAVQTAANAFEAGQILQAGRVDLLLSDIMLDGTGTGVALAKQARSDDKGLKVILMSGYADAALTAELADFGDMGWLEKPFDRSRLSCELRRALNRACHPPVAPQPKSGQ